MIDFALYIEIGDHLADLEARDEPRGSAQVALDWFKRQGLQRNGELEYAMAAVMRLIGHPKGDDWNKKRREDLDRLAWTFHRAWVDRYGFRDGTNQAGIEWCRTH